MKINENLIVSVDWFLQYKVEHAKNILYKTTLLLCKDKSIGLFQVRPYKSEKVVQEIKLENLTKNTSKKIADNVHEVKYIIANKLW